MFIHVGTPPHQHDVIQIFPFPLVHRRSHHASAKTTLHRTARGWAGEERVHKEDSTHTHHQAFRQNGIKIHFTSYACTCREREHGTAYVVLGARGVQRAKPAPPSNTVATKLLIQTVGFPKQLLLQMLPRPSTLIQLKVNVHTCIVRTCFPTMLAE